MIAKTYKVDLGLGVPEKKKKKKKVVKEPKTQYSILKDDNYFTEVSSRRATSPSKNVVQGQVPKKPGVKKKKKKGQSTLIFEDHLEPETVLQARWSEKSPSSRKQGLGSSEFLRGEKKKKGKSLPALAMSRGLGMETSPSSRKDESVTRDGKKLKKHKKEKKAQHTMAFSAKNPWFSEARDALFACPVGRPGEEQAASGQKRKQGSPREHTVKMKKKKKIHQERDTSPGLPEAFRSMERKGSKKKPAKIEAPEYIPIGDGPQTPVKKKKSKKQAEQPGVEELALKRKKKKRKERGEVGEPCEEGTDTDLEVVLEKKGNMDEAHIDQMRRKALQEEIDRESGKTEASETRKWTGTQFGQWDTAGFENDNQKLKFLKLMGGFKNLSPSFSRPSGRIGRHNMALSKKAADTLQQNLQQDYDRAMSWKYNRGSGLGFSTAPTRAMSWKYNRGSGLGFSTAPTKVFYIDRNASRSIKYED